MGLLNLFSKSAPTLLRLPRGSFTVDRHGRVLVGTLPGSFPADMMAEIAEQVLDTFHGATAAQLPLSELNINYPSLKITARELRGGAIIYLTPIAPYAQPN
jgi:hypothetical protein